MVARGRIGQSDLQYESKSSVEKSGPEWVLSSQLSLTAHAMLIYFCFNTLAAAHKHKHTDCNALTF